MVTRLKNLIKHLAEQARILQEEIYKSLSDLSNEKDYIENKVTRIYIENIPNFLKKTTFKNNKINIEQFSDFFSQIIINSIFLGWIRSYIKGNSPKEFRISFLQDILPTVPFIKEIFFSLKSILPTQIYDKIIISVEKLLRKTQLNIEEKTMDIFIATYYSDFLLFYDKEKAKALGIIDTPTEIVDYMVDGIDKILKNYFNESKGIASPNIKCLDPASGTMTYTCSIIRKAYKNLKLEYETDFTNLMQKFERWIINQFLENTYSFEILDVPYTLGYLKTIMVIEDFGININWSKYKLKSFLNNILMERSLELLESSLRIKKISQEITNSSCIKSFKNILIVLGNPPYNISSKNNSEWIKNKIRDYKKGLTERNLKILSDDYIKFIRLSHWLVAEKNKNGIIALITNNKYFYGDIFRKIRESLKKDFDIIYSVNLHGDMRKGESGNPFDIRVGVGIIFLVRLFNHSDEKCKIFTLDIPDESKIKKFENLKEGFKFEKFHQLQNLKYFIDLDTNSDIEKEFDSYQDINDFFIHRPKSGIMTGRDTLVINITKRELNENYQLFYNKELGKLKAKNIEFNNTKNWNIEEALDKKIKENPKIIKINYRGFDVRYLLYDPRLIEGHRMGYIDQISIDNLAISTTKSIRKNSSFSHCLITKYPIEKCFLSINDTSYAFLQKFNGKNNIKIPDNIKFQVDSNQLFFYIYALLFSTIYRTRYSSQLLRYFPKIPLTNNKELFLNLSNLGLKLGRIHLFMEDEIDVKYFPISSTKNFLISDDFYYDEKKQKIFFGKEFDRFWIGKITFKIWNFKIGGKRQLYEWLYSRRYSCKYKKNSIKRALTKKEINYLLKICASIKKSLEIIDLIDLDIKKLLNI